MPNNFMSHAKSIKSYYKLCSNCFNSEGKIFEPLIVLQKFYLYSSSVILIILT